MEEMCPEACLPVPFKFDKNCEAWEDPKCTDEDCDARAKKGECTEDPDYMLSMCIFSCENVPVGDYTYQGCYINTKTGDILEEDLALGPHTEGFTPETCREMCQNYPYFAVMASGICSCDYSFGDPARKYT